MYELCIRLVTIAPCFACSKCWLLIISSGANELKNLHYLPRASEPREFLFEDRTRCHADHVDHGPERRTTAAVGMLKAVYKRGDK